MLTKIQVLVLLSIFVVAINNSVNTLASFGDISQEARSLKLKIDFFLFKRKSSLATRDYVIAGHLGA